MSCLASSTGRLSGECAPVLAGLSHGSDCARSDEATCGLDGQCDGRGACRRWKSGTPCRTPTCSTDLRGALAVRTCDGTGTCAEAAPVSCGQYLCSASAGRCPSSCSVSLDCVDSSFCGAGSCRPKLDSRSSCSGPDQCKSGFCDMAPVGYCKNSVDLECDVENGGCISNRVDYGPCIFSFGCR